jgi:hypothetical protein
MAEVRLRILDRVCVIRLVGDAPHLREVGMDGLPRDEVGFELVNIDALAFKVAAGVSALTGADVISGEQAVRVFDFAVKGLQVGIMHDGVEQFLVEIYGQLAKASSVTVNRSPPGFKLYAKISESIVRKYPLYFTLGIYTLLLTGLSS